MSRTLGSTLFDVIFGLLAPPICFLLDPGVMFGGGLGLGLPAWAPLFVLAVAGTAMSALFAWHTVGGRWRTLDAILCGILFVGSAVALVVGLGVFPFALALLLIGLLGFVPLVTAFVCFRAARQALASAGGPDGRMLAAATALLVVISAAGYQIQADRAIDGLVSSVVRAPDAAAADRALDGFEQWRPLLPRREIARRGQALLGREDWRGNEYATAYRKLTGMEMSQGRGAD